MKGMRNSSCSMGVGGSGSATGLKRSDGGMGSSGIGGVERAGVVNRLGRPVIPVEDDDAGAVGGDFLGGRVDEAHDDQPVPDLREPGGGPVDADGAAAGFSDDDVGGEAVAVLAVGDDDRLVGEQA